MKNTDCTTVPCTWRLRDRHGVRHENQERDPRLAVVSNRRPSTLKEGSRQAKLPQYQKLEQLLYGHAVCQASYTRCCSPFLTFDHLKSHSVCRDLRIWIKHHKRNKFQFVPSYREPENHFVSGQNQGRRDSTNKRRNSKSQDHSQQQMGRQRRQSIHTQG